MSTTVYAYELDPYGTDPNNKITGERHTITAANGTDLNFFIPKNAPFHRRSFVLTNVSTGLPMRPGYDYYFGYRFDQMLLSGGMQPIYGAIVFNDRLFSGDVDITYQTLGGEFTLDTNAILTLLANKQLDPRTVTWGAVVDIPTDLPPVAHRHLVDDMTGMSEVVARLYDLIDATGSGFNKTMQSLLEHIADHNNPHHITLEDLGIDDLGNLVPATKEEAEAGTDTVHYMTALRVAQYCTANVIPVITAHANNNNNPHGVTATQVGLGNLGNYPVASNTEAAAGSATNRYMTPAATKAAIDVLAVAALAFHTGDVTNPHKVTATQVGLGNVGNYALATVPEAIAGVSNLKYMTPYLVQQAIANGSGQGLAAHLSDFDNPHNVTKTQVGLGNVDNFATATNPDMIALTSDELFVTPSNLQAFLNGPVTDRIASGGGDITKETVGLGKVENYAPATDSDVLEESSTAYSTPATVATQIEQLVVTDPAYIYSDYLAQDLVNQPPYASAIDVSSALLGIWSGSEKGIQVTPKADAVDAIYTELDYNLEDGRSPVNAYAFTGKFEQNDNSARIGFPLFLYSNPSDPTDTKYYTISYDGTQLSHRIMSTDGTTATIGTPVTLTTAQQAAVGVLPGYRVNLTRNGAISLTLLGTDGSTIATLSTTVTYLVGVVGVNATDLTYIFGFYLRGSDVPSGPQNFIPDNYPNLNAVATTLSGNVYTYADGTWTTSGNPDPLVFKKGRYYYNQYTEELLFAVSTSKLLPLSSPKSGIVDSEDVTATAVDGGVQLFVRDATVDA